MRVWWAREQRGLINMTWQKIINLSDGTNPGDAVNFSQLSNIVQPTSIKNRIVYTCERNWTSTWPYAWWNWATSTLWWYVPIDWVIVEVSLSDDLSNPAWWVHSLNVNETNVFQFTQAWRITTVTPNVSVVKWDFIAFDTVTSGSWDNRVATIVLEYDIPITWLKWDQWDPGNDWLNWWTTISWLSLPAANSLPIWTIFRINNWTKTWVDQDEYITDWSSWIFLGNVLWLAWVWTQIDFLKCFFLDSNSVNSTSELAINTFQTTPEFVSNPALFTLSSGWVTVNQSWVYEVYFNLYFTSTSQRPNVWCKVSINWISQPWYSASWYIRAASGHNESTTWLINTLQLNSWDIIWINTQQLALAWVVNMVWSESIFYIKKTW